MKLKTKFQDEYFDFGEVVEANVYYGGKGRIRVVAESTKGRAIAFYFETLKGVNGMFEDYEEPKYYWYIDDAGVIQIDEVLASEINMRKPVGNYFESREEAEKAVKRLRAWRRLKDKGFRFVPEASYVEQAEETEESMMFIACTMNDCHDFIFGDNADIKLLFSGEDD